jgi:hypothetical protein
MVPPGSDVVWIVSEEEADTTEIVSDFEAVCGFPEESTTFTVKLDWPAVVGVPEIWPLDAKLSPAGRVPEARDHVYGVIPPAAARVVL